MDLEDVKYSIGAMVLVMCIFFIALLWLIKAERNRIDKIEKHLGYYMEDKKYDHRRYPKGFDEEY